MTAACIRKVLMEQRDILYLLLLAGNTLCDLCERRIRLWFTAVFSVLGLLESLGSGRSAGQAAAAMIPGAGIILMSFLSGGAVGMGDGILLAAGGLFRDAGFLFALAAAGFMLSGTVSGILLVIKKDRRMCIPFVPFLTAGYVMLVFMGG